MLLIASVPVLAIVAVASPSREKTLWTTLLLPLAWAVAAPDVATALATVLMLIVPLLVRVALALPLLNTLVP